MNQKGNLLIIIILAMAALVLILPATMYLFKPVDLIARIIISLIIFMNVRTYLGNGVISLVMTGILIYFLVIKHAYIAASSTFILLVLLSFSVFSVIIWGIGTTMRKG